MTKYRDILRLHSHRHIWREISSRIIAESLNCSRNTIRKVLERAEIASIVLPLSDNMTDKVLEQKLFGKHTAICKRKTPDFEYIHQ